MDRIQQLWEKAREGAVAVIDCREEIPCNPCEHACPKGAIEVGENICDLPRYDLERCDGCGRCVALCPGMAIYLLDRSSRDGKARVTLPYEMKEQIIKGEEVWALDEAGDPLGKGKVVGVAKTGRKDRSLLVKLEVPEEWALKVRGLRVRVMSLEGPQEVHGYTQEADCLLCRCEEISYSSAREYTAMGFNALGALRRSSRVGLGYCQGRFCQEMLAGEFAAQASRAPEDVGAFKVRPPVRPVRLSRLGGEDG
jgi:ferredoxin